MVLEPCPDAQRSRTRTDGSALSVGVTFDGPRCEIWIQGSLDRYSVVALRTQADQITLEPFEEVVVHLGRQQDLDGAGLDELAALRAMADGRGAAFRVEGPTQPLPNRLRPAAPRHGPGH